MKLWLFSLVDLENGEGIVRLNWCFSGGMHSAKESFCRISCRIKECGGLMLKEWNHLCQNKVYLKTSDKKYYYIEIIVAVTLPYHLYHFQQLCFVLYKYRNLLYPRLPFFSKVWCLNLSLSFVNCIDILLNT